jgi:ATP-dependent RNA helicase HelY
VSPPRRPAPRRRRPRAPRPRTSSGSAAIAGPTNPDLRARDAFLARIGVDLDDFQLRAIDVLDEGKSVLVAAPTGAGKTLVAEYAIARALASGGKAFYTTPLKALSNQKFHDLREQLGDDQVGLLTGDNAINGDAPVVVMTTEVLRNMIYAGSRALRRLQYVILDEVHYLQNRFRGAVWEEVIIHLPPEVTLVALSATVSNTEEVADWLRTVRGDTEAVIEEKRPVELVHWYAVGERGTDGFHLLPTFAGGEGDTLRPNPDVERIDRAAITRKAGGPRPRGRLFTPSRLDIVDRLASDGMLPAIFFVFSRKGCDQAVEQCLAAGLRLTSGDERREIRRIADAHVANLENSDLEVLGYGSFVEGLAAGFGAHHAGMVPPLKEAVEEAFTAGLVKVVFATETLALGINMPARSVVIEKLSKFTGEHHELLTPGEYTQLAGRAGRRGLDTVGHAIVEWSPFVSFDQVTSLASRRTYALTSSFRPTYNMAVNLVRRYDPDEAHRLLNLSFAQFHSDREVVALERQLARDRARLDHLHATARAEQGDIWEFIELREAREVARRELSSRAAIDRALERLRPGDVIRGPRGERVAIVRHEGGKAASTRVLAISDTRQLTRFSARDFSQAPPRIGRIDLPQPYAPRTPEYRRSVAAGLRGLPEDEALSTPRHRLAELDARLAAHPLAELPGLETHVRAALHARRLERDLARTTRHVRSRNESLGRQFDRVNHVLETWGYVDGWSLTSAGELLAGLYTETDLLLAEALRDGLFADLEAAELAAVVSCFTYERRGADLAAPARGARWPTRRIGAAVRRVESFAAALHELETEARLPPTRPVDSGFVPYAYDWAMGDDLADVLDDDELTGGDFVRNVRQMIDLLEQLAVVGTPETAPAARAAAAACSRGVIAASALS